MPHVVGGDPLQDTPLAACLEDQLEIALLEIAESPVDQLGGTAGGAAGKIRLFDQPHVESAERRIPGDTCPKNASANDQDVKVLVRQSRNVAIHSKCLKYSM